MVHVSRFTFYALLSWYIIATLHIFPNELAYFNELIGGPKNGYRYLADSNLDWGQSTETFTAYVEAHPDVQTHPPATKFRPAPGRYIVGASHLQGLGIDDPDAYAWFRQREPVEIVNNNLLIYDVDPFAVDWLAQCGAPVTPLDEDAIAQGFATAPPLPHADFDCTQAWLYPNGGSKSGVYALERGLMQETRLCLPDFLPCPVTPNDPFIARHLDSARLSFDRDHKGELSPFVLYEMPLFVRIAPLSMVYAVPVDTTPAELRGLSPVASPVSLDGPLVYLGAQAHRVTETVEVETWWQVQNGPITRSFSIMAHLITLHGEVIGTDDGLGISPLVLAEGDVVVQRHRFPQPLTGVEVWLRTGAYWLDTLARWPVLDGEAPRDAVLLEAMSFDD